MHVLMQNLTLSRNREFHCYCNLIVIHHPTAHLAYASSLFAKQYLENLRSQCLVLCHKLF